MAPLLEVKNLNVTFQGDFGSNTVTDNICFHVRRGEVLCIVGESGCGKSVTGLAVMGLLAANGTAEGQVLFEGKNLLGLSEKELDKVRGKEISMIYQDALASLNPVFTVGNQLEEPLRTHLQMDRKSARAEALNLLKKVGLPDAEAALKKYPFELSGGQRQRVMIAMALACRPKLLIADEPTTALDVTVQAQIMRLIRKIRREMDMSVILITHDMGLVAQMADRVLVMYAGQIIEEADVYELFDHPRHPYTRALLASAPDIRGGNRRLAAIRGSVPENYGSLAGCRFADRCDECAEECRNPQRMREIPSACQNPAEGKNPGKEDISEAGLTRETSQSGRKTLETEIPSSEKTFIPHLVRCCRGGMPGSAGSSQRQTAKNLLQSEGKPIQPDGRQTQAGGDQIQSDKEQNKAGRPEILANGQEAENHA